MVAGLHDYLKGDASTPKAPKTNEDWGSLSPGPYVGVVKANNDSLRTNGYKVSRPRRLLVQGTFPGVASTTLLRIVTTSGRPLRRDERYLSRKPRLELN